MTQSLITYLIFDLVLRMSKICKLFVIDEVLAEWRIQSSSESFKSPEKFSSEIKKWIDKQILNNVIEKNKIKFYSKLNK